MDEPSEELFEDDEHDEETEVERECGRAASSVDDEELEEDEEEEDKVDLDFFIFLARLGFLKLNMLWLAGLWQLVNDKLFIRIRTSFCFH